MAQLRARLHPDDLPLLDQVMIDCQRDGQPHNARVRIIRPDGEIRYTLAHGQAHFDEQGTPVAVVGTLQDITPLALAKQALHETNEQLERRVEERTRELTQANEELKRENEQRRAAEEELRNEQRLLEQLLMAHERDRQLTAYEIHDGFVQEAVGAKMHLEAFQRRLATMPHAPTADLDASIKLLGHAVAEGRRLITGLRPPIIDEAGIVAALEYLVREHHVPGVLEIEFAHQTSFDRLTPLLEGSIFRIVQETLTNVARHSHSERALVRLTQDGDRLRLEIRDWGVGFDPGTVLEHRYGLQSIRERARLLRGKAVIGSRRGEGTCIVVDLPLVLPT
jgi:signal transduction histidine kinase